MCFPEGSNTVVEKGKIISEFQWLLSSEWYLKALRGRGVCPVFFVSDFLTLWYFTSILLLSFLHECFIPWHPNGIHFDTRGYPYLLFHFLCDWLYGSLFWRFSFIVSFWLHKPERIPKDFWISCCYTSRSTKHFQVKCSIVEIITTKPENKKF